MSSTLGASVQESLSNLTSTASLDDINGNKFVIPLIITCVIVVLVLFAVATAVAVYMLKRKKRRKQERAVIATLDGDLDFTFCNPNGEDLKSPSQNGEQHVQDNSQREPQAEEYVSSEAIDVQFE